MPRYERQMALMEDLILTLQVLAKEVEKLEARMAQSGVHKPGDSQIRVVVSSLSELHNRATKLKERAED